ncbi:RNA polymerase I associated factor, A49-like protein [Calocera cornea HHB12733]|uniref:RNA polymerase I associated factor, A49-like protein n=1 Tax=Calocera cornea HHB12733 TaxID=1353952 RepID=A0A165GJL6_9BASI|nr:RNA polymerase I associated factor, A49-like protein [Calocera cornea HHB12733]
MQKRQMVSIVNSTNAPENCGPIVASFPALVPSSSTTFNCYRHLEDHEPRATGFLSEKSILLGKNNGVNFISVNRDAAANSAGSFSEYLVAIHDRNIDKVVIRAAPLYILSREVNRLRQAPFGNGTATRRIQARNVLGQAFGSKRSRAAIQAAERNRVDVSAMNDIAQHLQDDININTRTLPDINESDAQDQSRPGPPPNLDAEEPAQVYSVSSIVPDSELRACPSRELLAAATENDRDRILPYSRSSWITQHLNFAIQQGKKSRQKLKLLFYISCMFGFRQATMSRGSEKVQERMSRIPPVIQEGLWARYSEASRLSQRNRVTSEMDVRLLAHMFVLILFVDDFAANIGMIASDLHLPVARVMKIFRAIGCKLETPNLTDRNRLGLPRDTPLDRRAFLRIPLDFPKPARGRVQRP